MKKILTLFAFTMVLFTPVLKAQTDTVAVVDSLQTTYDELDTLEMESLMNVKITLDVSEVFLIQHHYKGLENVTLETLMKVKINKSDVEQRSLTLAELENLPIEQILKLEAKMKTDQGVQTIDIDLSDFSLEELLQMNMSVQTDIEKQKK